MDKSLAHFFLEFFQHCWCCNAKGVTKNDLPPPETVQENYRKNVQDLCP